MKKKGYSESVVRAIDNVLHLERILWDFDDKEGIFSFPLDIESLDRIFYSIYVQKNAFTTLAAAPILADVSDKEMMNSLVMFCNIVNNGISWGNFEADIETGEIRFHVYVDCEGIPAPSKEMVRNSIFSAAAMHMTFKPGIMALINKKCDTAEEAFEKCRNNIAAFLENDAETQQD